MNIFRPKPKPPIVVPPNPALPGRWVRGTVRGRGGDLLDVPAVATLNVDNGDVIQGTWDGPHFCCELKATTPAPFGADLWITDADGYQRKDTRFVLKDFNNPQKNDQDASNQYLPDITLDVSWPAVPSRDQVCDVQVGFQGMSATTEEFGTFPCFGPETTSFSRDTDLVWYIQQMMSKGWTHVEFAVSWNYQTSVFRLPGRDLSNNLAELKRRIALAITTGVKGVLLMCAGDGLGSGPGYNDSFGWTYGREWLLANFERIYNAMGPTPEDPRDCRPWIVFSSGYDGTDSYAWGTADNVVEWWRAARRIIDAGGVGYLAQHYGSGHCQIGGAWDGEATYVNGPGMALDVILQEFPAAPPMPTDSPDSVFQMLGRMIRPYNRPPEQSPLDDPYPPYYLKQGTPRGRYFYIAYEFDTYHWVHGMIDAAGVQRDREYLQRCGARAC